MRCGRRDVRSIRDQRQRASPLICATINVVLARDVSLLLTQNFGTLRERVSDSWLSGDATFSGSAKLASECGPCSSSTSADNGDDVNRPPAFATALALPCLAKAAPGTLLNNADADYLLAVERCAGCAHAEPRRSRDACCATGICQSIRTRHCGRAIHCRERACCTPSRAFSKPATCCNFKKRMRAQRAMDN